MISHSTLAQRKSRQNLLIALAVGVGSWAQALPADAAATGRKASNKTLIKTATNAPVPTARAMAPQPAASPLITVISIGDQRVTVYSGDTPVARSSVSSGMAGHRTPTGIFSVIGKERYHESNLYSNAPMPFMQRITWSGVALHEGNLPGYPASHGCIRLSSEFAQRLFGMSRMGMRVIVADRDLAPVPFAHATLPSPTFTRALQVATLALDGRMQLGATQPDANADTAARLLNPMERGRLEQSRAKALAQEAQADAQALLEIAALRGEEARAAAETARTTSHALRAVTAGREAAADSQLRLATLDDTARQRLADQRTALDHAYAQATRVYADAKTHADGADAAAFQAAAEAKAAVTERDAAEQAARVAQRATEPVSIFISRKERRVFVRQGFEQVFSADIEIVDAELPLGTHTFTAIAAPSASDHTSGHTSGHDNGAMKWVAVTIPGQARVEAAMAPRPAKGQAAVEARAQVLAVSATAALDRIKFSDDVLEAISRKVWTGASLTISDYGISTETGKGTDFVVLTK